MSRLANRRPPAPPELKALEPMLLTQARSVPVADEGHLVELKWDGWRVMAAVSGHQAWLKTRRGADASMWFPEVVRGLSSLPGGLHILDGEVCVLDDQGRSDFDRLQRRARMRAERKGCDPVVFCAWDAVVVDGEDVSSRPIEERKALLAELLQGRPPATLYVSHFDGNAAWLFEQVKRLELEGIVLKRKGSVYQPGQISADWVKVKPPGPMPRHSFRSHR